VLKLAVTGVARFASAWVTGSLLRLLVRVLDRQAEAPTSVAEAELAGFLHGADAAGQLEWE